MRAQLIGKVNDGVNDNQLDVEPDRNYGGSLFAESQRGSDVSRETLIAIPPWENSRQRSSILRPTRARARSALIHMGSII